VTAYMWVPKDEMPLNSRLIDIVFNVRSYTRNDPILIIATAS